MSIKNLNSLKIDIYADSVNLSVIKNLYNNPLIKGFTTNISLMRKHGIKNYQSFAKQVLSLVTDKPVCFGTFADKNHEIIQQAKFISSWSKNVYVKIPVVNTKGEFLGKVIEKLSNDGIKLNITAVFTKKQVAEIKTVLNKNMPAIISIFSGRISETGIDPITHFKECISEKNQKNIDFLWASSRELFNIYHAEKAGADIITITQDIINKFKNIEKDLNLFTIETVNMFYNDALKAKYRLDY